MAYADPVTLCKRSGTTLPGWRDQTKCPVCGQAITFVSAKRPGTYGMTTHRVIKKHNV